MATMRSARVLAWEAGQCWICLETCREQGQRGPLRAHTWCRKMHDLGYRVAAIRVLRQQESAS